MAPTPHDAARPQLATLHEIALALSAELEPRRLYEGIVHGARRLLGAAVAGAASWDPGTEQLVLEASAGSDTPLGAAAPAEAPVCVGRAFTERRTVVVEDLAAEPRAHGAARRLGLHAGVAVPITRETRAIGVVFVADTDPARRFVDEDVRLLEILVGHVSLALTNAETVAAAARRMARIEEHFTALRGIVEARRRETVLERSLDCATTILGADRAAVYLVDARMDVAIVAGRRLSRPYLEAVARGYRRSAGGLLPFTRAPIFIPDLQTDPRTRPIHELAAQEGIHSSLLLPLARGEALYGALALYHDVAWSYGPDDIAFARACADQLALALANALLLEQSERQLSQLRVLEAVVQAVSEPLPLLERCRRGAQAIVDRGGATAAWVFLAEDGAPKTSVRAGTTPVPDRAAQDAARAALAARLPVTHPVLGTDTLVAAPIAHPDRPLGAVVLAPPRPRHGEPRPATTMLTFEEGEDPASHHEFVATVAGQLATAIANARLYEEAATLGARLGAVVDSMPTAMLVYDRDDRITVYNRKVLEIYGIDGRDLRGWTPADFVREIGHCFADPAVPEEISRRVPQHRASADRLEFELSHPKRRVIERISAPLRLPDGQHLGQVVLYHELTDVRDAESAKAEFVTMAGHELRAPLDGARGVARETAQALRGQGQADAAGRVDRIDALLGRLSGVVDELLDMTLLDAGQLTLSRTQFDYGALVAEAVESARQMERDHDIELAAPASPVPLVADRARLGRVLHHVLGDALGHAKDGTALAVQVEAGPDRVVTSIKARAGVAAPNAQLTSPGVGLARNLSREIVELHGGHLETVYAPDRTRIVRFSVPAVAAAGRVQP